LKLFPGFLRRKKAQLIYSGGKILAQNRRQRRFFKCKYIGPQARFTHFPNSLSHSGETVPLIRISRRGGGWIQSDKKAGGVEDMGGGGA
jgi:hypothetical protein